MVVTEIEAPRLIVSCSEQMRDFYQSWLGQSPRPLSEEMIEEQLVCSGWYQTAVQQKQDEIYRLSAPLTTPALLVEGNREFAKIQSPIEEAYGLPMVFGLQPGHTSAQTSQEFLHAVGYDTSSGISGKNDLLMPRTSVSPHKVRLRKVMHYRGGRSEPQVYKEVSVKKKQTTLEGLLEHNSEIGVQVTDFLPFQHFLNKTGHEVKEKKEKGHCKVFRHPDDALVIELVGGVPYADGSRGAHLEIAYEVWGNMTSEKAIRDVSSRILFLSERLVPPENIQPASFGGHSKTNRAFKQYLGDGYSKTG